MAFSMVTRTTFLLLVNTARTTTRTSLSYTTPSLKISVSPTPKPNSLYARLNPLQPTIRVHMPHTISFKPTFFPLPKNAIPIIRPIKPYRRRQLRFRELLRIRRPHRTGSDDGNVTVDEPLVADQACSLVERRARLRVQGALVPVDIVVPVVRPNMVVELAHLDRMLPAEVFPQLALLLRLVSVVRKMERYDLACDVVGDDGRVVSGLGRGADDVAVGFLWCGGLAGRFAGRFVDAPLAALTILAAVSGALAPGADEGAGVLTGIVGAGFGHGGIGGGFRNELRMM